MKPRTILVLVLAVVCGIMAAVGIRLIKAGQVGDAVELFPVVHAASDILRGEKINLEALTVVKLPRSQVPEGCLTKMEDAAGRVAHFPMLKGDVLSEMKLSPKGSGSGMAALIRPGMRAFTIQTASLSSSMAGFLLPGNRVDVLLTVAGQGSNDDSSGGGTTITLLQNIEILAVHTSVDAPSVNKIDPDQARSVTLLVTPAEAARLDLGQNKGTLHLSMRNPLDDEISEAPPATVADLPLPKRTPPPEPEEKPELEAVASAPPVIPEPPAAAVLPPPPPPPEPTYEDRVLITRTLRGTTVGRDRVTTRLPARARTNFPNPFASMNP